VYSAVPSPLERVVPSSPSKTGAANESFDLMGFELPPGTIVATQAWSMHRNASIFPSPETFLPERWLDSDKAGSAERLSRMNQYLMPFGTGSRVCGGQNLAQVMMRIVIAYIVRNFDVVAADETNEQSMEIKDSFVGFLP
jgi:cytochrome P450